MAIKRIPRLSDVATTSDLSSSHATYTTNFVHNITAAGRYRITAWAGGASGDPGIGGGGGGELVQVVRNLSVGGQITGIVAARIGTDGAVGSGYDGDDTRLTLPDGTVITAHGGKTASNGGAGGSGGININGMNRSGNVGGAGGAIGTLNGGRGDNGTGARVPGGGGFNGGGTQTHGEGGLVLIIREA